MKLLNRTIGLLILSGVVGCSAGGDEALKNRADIESQKQAENDVKYQKESLDARATEMEGDLQRRHAFMQAIKGTFQGSYTLEEMNFKIEVSLYPNLNPVDYNRVRTPEEVTEDLNDLSLNVQVRQWLDGSPESSSGCRIEGIRPDWVAGQIQIISESCPNMFVFALTKDDIDLNLPRNDLYKSAIQEAPLLSQLIMNEELDTVGKLMGLMRPTLNANTNHFVLERSSQ